MRLSSGICSGCTVCWETPQHADDVCRRYRRIHYGCVASQKWQTGLQFCRSLELGVITMNNDIIRRVGALHDMKIEDEHISAVLRGEETFLPEDVIQTITKATETHTRDILHKLRELQVDLRANPAMFIGGGSILFEEYIKASNLVSKADFIEDPKANAIGYQMLASKQLGYRPTA